MLNDRLETLGKLSNLKVRLYEKNCVKYFIFAQCGRDVASFCTYPKAKAFAQGIKLGKEIAQKV